MNFTVNNLEELFHELKFKDAKIISEIKEYSYGKFYQIEDISKTIIELWEYYSKEYKKMVEEESKKNKK